MDPTSKIITAGIIVDDYKLERFKTELKLSGYTDYEIKRYFKEEKGLSSVLPNASLIKIKVPENKLFEIKNICRGVELFFKQSN